MVPDKYKRHAHHWLILHGRYVCVARRPLCEQCLIADLCKWPGKTVLMATIRSRSLGGVLSPEREPSTDAQRPVRCQSQNGT